jgi:SNF2 family DNA or RNA helicase
MAARAQPAILEPSVKPRWKHQAESLDFFDRSPIGFDNSDPGTGKTRVQVESYANRSKSRRRMLVLCPKTLMRPAWGADIERFAPRLTASFADADNREEAFKTGTDVVVMNIDGVKWFTDKSKAEERRRRKYLQDFDHLVIDEYTAYKHPTSQRSKAIKALKGYFTHRRAMSGTPNPNTVLELWHPALLLDNGARLGTSYYGLRAAMQVPEQIGPSANHLRWTDRPGANQAVNELLSDITIRHAFEDVMTHVPPNHRDVKVFSLAPRAKKAYDKMENDFLLELEGGKLANAVHAASLRTKLLQIASGAVYSSEDDYQLIDPQRYELIADLVEERKHSLVFFNWKHQRDFLAREFEKRGISFAIIDGNVTRHGERDAIVERYQAGKYQTLLLHPRTGAHGLTLTRGDTTIVSSPFYEADLLKQAIHRVYRGDQDKVTNTILVQAKGTVEELVYARLDDKYDRMTDLLDMMRQNRK